jgi:hypothetical protein
VRRAGGPWALLPWVALATVGVWLMRNPSDTSAVNDHGQARPPARGSVEEARGRRALTEAAATGRAEGERGAQPWRTSRRVAVMYVDGSFDPLNGPLIGFALGNAIGLLPTEWKVEVHTQGNLPAALLTRFRHHLDTGK